MIVCQELSTTLYWLKDPNANKLYLLQSYQLKLIITIIERNHQGFQFLNVFFVTVWWKIMLLKLKLETLKIFYVYFFHLFI